MGLLLAAGCGGDSQGEGGGSSSAIPMEGFVRALAAAACDAAEVCEPDPYIRKLSDDGTCVEALERVINFNFAGIVAEARFGDATFDEAAARACLDSFERRCPPAFDLLINGIRPEAWCPEAFPDCPQHEREPWQEPLAQGAACDYGGRPCALGLRCSLGSNTCESCEGDDAAGSQCELDPEAVQVLADIYLVDRREGDTCDRRNFRAACNVGLQCIVAESVCVAPRAAGEPCPTGEECAGNCGSSGLCEPACGVQSQ